MAKWEVYVPQFWYETVIVEADSRADAIEKVLEGNLGEYQGDSEFDHTIDDITLWDAESCAND
jgi:hypothetical protein